MVEYRNLSNAMETRDHSKNGASLKSQMSRGMMFCLLSLIILFSSCDYDVKNENSNSVNSGIKVEIFASSKNITFDSGEDTKEVILTCDIALTDSIRPKWITTIKEGDKGRQIFHLTASKNESSDTRTGSIMFTGHELIGNTLQKASITISVTQLGQQ